MIWDPGSLSVRSNGGSPWQQAASPLPLPPAGILPKANWCPWLGDRPLLPGGGEGEQGGCLSWLTLALLISCSLDRCASCLGFQRAVGVG